MSKRVLTIEEIDKILNVSEEMKSYEKPKDQICTRCRSTDTVTFQKQTRSADEGMTNFSSCNACGHRWKPPS